MTRQRHSGYWTKETVIKEIHEHIAKGLSVNPSIAYKEHQVMVKWGRTLFGDWSTALEAAGLVTEDWYVNNPKGYWTEDKVKEEMVKRKTEGKGLYKYELIAEDAKLLYAMVTTFGSWETAVKAIGDKVSDHLVRRPKHYWTRETVTKELQERKDMGSSLKPADIKRENSSLYSYTEDLYPTWKEAYETIGENIDDYRDRRNYRVWSKEAVTAEIQLRNEQGLSLAATVVAVEDGSLYKSALKYYKRWKLALDTLNG